MGNLTRLDLLSLNDNQLTGPIPRRLEKIDYSYTINMVSYSSSFEMYLGGNQFSGCVTNKLRQKLRDFDAVDLPAC